MLKNTFIHIPGIGPKREGALHARGITTWERFLAGPHETKLPASLADRAVEALEESAYRLKSGEARFFHHNLPPRERWRMWGEFSQEAVFLDIETTGMMAPLDYVTVVGLHDARGTHTFIRGENLFTLPEVLEKHKLIVTFNGAQFDLPFLRAHMGDIFGRHGHIDLRFVLQRLGYRGGLKSIERQMGIRRPGEVEGIDGFEAVLLWHRYLRGDERALERLVAYNRQDVENLRELMEFAYEKLRSELLPQT